MRRRSRKPLVGVTLGDVAGIGPEIVAKILGKEVVYRICRPFVIGDPSTLRRAAEIAGIGLDVNSMGSVESYAPTFGGVTVLDVKVEGARNVKIGAVSEIAGQTALAYLKRGVELALQDRVAALVLAPMNKEAMRMAGNPHPDEAGLMADYANLSIVDVVWKYKSFFKSTVVGHVPFRAIPDMVTTRAVLRAIMALHRTVSFFTIDRPRLGVAALNPHGGEGGLFGTEERTKIAPAIASARSKGIDVHGPYPADTIYQRGLRGEFDGVVSMYHDQGNVALKTVGFGEIVNIYAGLPFVCTGPSHGTAFDIAGQGVAACANILDALQVAVNLAVKNG
jgi:4-hydroxythreonine-4-phosphate dehydrogenase